jgi:hypothetical protein
MRVGNLRTGRKKEFLQVLMRAFEVFSAKIILSASSACAEYFMRVVRMRYFYVHTAAISIFLIILKVPKSENFDLLFFALIIHVWGGD